MLAPAKLPHFSPLGGMTYGPELLYALDREDLLTHAPADQHGAIWADLAGTARQYEHEAGIYTAFVLEHYGDILDVESGDRVDVTPPRRLR